VVEIAIFLLTGRLFYLDLREDVLTLKLLGCSSEKIKMLLMTGAFVSISAHVENRGKYGKLKIFSDVLATTVSCFLTSTVSIPA